MTDQPTTEPRGPIDYARRQQAERGAGAAPAGLREQYAAAIHKALRDYGEGDDDPGTGSDYGDQTAVVLAVRDREMEQLREQLAARDAALATYTAQLVRDQAALAAAKKCARGIGAWGVLQAIDNASAPAPDGGPTVAEAAADDEAHWTTKYDRP